MMWAEKMYFAFFYFISVCGVHYLWSFITVVWFDCIQPRSVYQTSPSLHPPEKSFLEGELSGLIDNAILEILDILYFKDNIQL